MKILRNIPLTKKQLGKRNNPNEKLILKQMIKANENRLSKELKRIYKDELNG
jgi:hypothetical protein